MRLSAASLAALALALATPAPARAQLVPNGGFEAGPSIPPQNPVYAVSSGSAVLDEWSVVSGSVSIVTDNYWVPHSGARSVALSSSGPGAIEQWVPTSPGGSYVLRFWVSGEPFSLPTIKHLRVTVADATHDFAYDVTPAWHWDMHWTQVSIAFMATAVATRLRFASLDASDFGPAVDDVSIELRSVSATPGARLALSRVTPDPLRGRGRLEFSLASPGRARVTVLDVLGRERGRLADGEFAAGPHALELDGGAAGMRPGLYLAVLEAGGARLVRRFTVLD